MKNPPNKPSQDKSPGKKTDLGDMNRRIGKKIKNEIVSCARNMEKRESAVYEKIYRNVDNSPGFGAGKLGNSTRSVKAFSQQKIVILPKSVLESIKNNTQFKVGLNNKQIYEAYLLSVSEFPNHPTEYPELKEDSYTALIEWKGGPKFADLTSINGTPISTDVSQLDNVTINEGGGAGNRPPGDPIVEGNTSSFTPFPVQSDYKKIIPDFNIGNTKSGAVTVAVTDTGNLFLNTSYLNINDEQRDFPLVKNAQLAYPAGYCSVLKYLDPTYRQQMIKPGTNNLPATNPDVLGSPYDDNAARHGTTISAIIAQNPRNGTDSNARILPVKCFDFLGAANLFDILCGFNYIFSRIKSDNIRVVNASWGFYAPREKEDQLKMLRKKIAALKTENVFVVTSAGNRPDLDEPAHNLEDGAIYPACFRNDELTNLITVTSVTYKLGASATGEDTEFLDKNTLDTIKRNYADDTKIVEDKLIEVENYSSKYVDLGVIAHPVQGLFSSPFKDKSGKNTAPAIVSGSSFAAAYVAAYLADLLRRKPEIKNKNDFFSQLNNIQTSPDLTSITAEGRYMTLPKEEYEQARLYVADFISNDDISTHI